MFLVLGVSGRKIRSPSSLYAQARPEALRRATVGEPALQLLRDVLDHEKASWKELWRGFPGLICRTLAQGGARAHKGSGPWPCLVFAITWRVGNKGKAMMLMSQGLRRGVTVHTGQDGP